MPNSGIIPVPTPVQAGNFKQTITIRRQTNTPDGKGGYTRAWTDIVTNARAEVVSESGREALVGHALQGINHYRITMRYVSGIEPSDQIKWSGEELNILAVSDPEGRRRIIEIMANNQIPQGA